MNVDRFMLYAGPRRDINVKFVTKDASPQLFQAATDYLDQIAERSRFAYKDVVHPFVMSEWLKANDFRVLRIKRDLTDVAYSMLAARWYYPRDAIHGHRGHYDASVFESAPSHYDQLETSMIESVIEGLIRADRALDSVPGEQVNYEDFIYDGTPIKNALAKLYPSSEIGDLNYIDYDFSRLRAKILERRSTSNYHRLREAISKVTAAIQS